MNSLVLRFPRNENGRDFIVGDIHGAYDLLWEGMKAVHFDKTVDRIFSVCDLIDRGKGSVRCLGFLRQPYVFAICGNHERMLVEGLKNGKLNKDAIDALANINYNGMRWMKDVSLETLNEIALTFKNLPIVIEIETDRGLVGLVHADVPKGMHWKDFVCRIKSGDDYCTRMALGMDISDDFHESRQRVENCREDGIPGIGRVFVGHTVLFAGMKRLGNVYAIDTGAVFGEAGRGKGHLTMVNPLMATGYLVSAQERPNPLLDLRVIGVIPDSPFSLLVNL
jgi:serine/threonine protein phosphatase 1